MSRSRSGKKTDALPSPIESESEYGGLAYADSTDYEDDDDHINKVHQDKGKGKEKEKEEFQMQEPLVQALNDAASKKGSGRHTQFGSVSLRSRSKSISRADGGSNASETGGRSGRNPSISSKASSGVSLSRPPLPFPPTAAGGGSHTPTQSQALSRSDSVSSSYSSASDSAIRNRTRADSSSTVARALGLSQAPPCDYARLGGPGVKGPAGARESRMRSASAASSAASSGSRSAHSGSQSNAGMEALLEDAAAAMSMSMSSPGVKQRSLFGSVSSSGRSAMSGGSSGGRALRRAETTASSTSSRDERSRRVGFNAVNDDDDEGQSVIGGAMVGGGSKAHRSNTVSGHLHQPQQVHSPDHRGGSSSSNAANKPVKLPMRSLTSPQLSQVPLGGGDGSSILTSSSSSRGMKERAGKKKVRACVRCVKSIEDGRWVSVDGGGVLCEKCWKGMYLPKVRLVFCFAIFYVGADGTF